jgi:hypothetical protein
MVIRDGTCAAVWGRLVGSRVSSHILLPGFLKPPLVRIQEECGSGGYACPISTGVVAPSVGWRIVKPVERRQHPVG